MSEEIVVREENAPVRSLEVIGNEIEMIKSNARNMISACEAYTRRSCFDIGMLLFEAKSTVPHGEYVPWLKTMGYSEPTASNLIRIYTEMGNDEAFASLSYTQMRELLPLSSEKRKEVLPEVEDKSSREIRRLVAELKAAEKAKEEAERRLAEQEAIEADKSVDVVKYEQEIKDLKDAVKDAEAETKAIEASAAEEKKARDKLFKAMDKSIKQKDSLIEELENSLKNPPKRELSAEEWALVRKEAAEAYAAEAMKKQRKERLQSDPVTVEVQILLNDVSEKVARIGSLLGAWESDMKDNLISFVGEGLRNVFASSGFKF